MRKTILFFCSLLISLAAWATEPEAVNVVKTDASLISTQLIEMQSVVFNESKTAMTIHKRDATSKTVSISDVRHITFGEYTVGNVTSLTNVADAHFSLYGNDIIHVECSDGIQTIHLYDATGALLTTIQGNNESHIQFSVSTLSTGIYIAQVRTSQALISQKIHIN